MTNEIKSRKFDEISILEFRTEIEKYLNVNFHFDGHGDPQLSGITFTHHYHRDPYGRYTYTDIFDLILYFYETLQNNNQLVTDLERARYYAGTGENRDD